MELVGATQVYSVGAMGGVAAEILHWWNLRTSLRLPRYASDPKYWSITAAMILLAGFIPWLQFGASAESWTVFQIGLAAPVVLQKLATAPPEPSGQMSAFKRSSMRDFFTW